MFMYACFMFAYIYYEKSLEMYIQFNSVHFKNLNYPTRGNFVVVMAGLYLLMT